MNGLAVQMASLLLGCAGMLVGLAPSFAQVGQVPIAPQSQSDLLTTQPLAIERSATTDRSSFDQGRLSNVADSIQANPTKPQPQRQVIPDSLIPRDLIRTPVRILNDNHPLEDFLPPAPNQSFGINLNRL